MSTPSSNVTIIDVDLGATVAQIISDEIRTISDATKADVAEAIAEQTKVVEARQRVLSVAKEKYTAISKVVERLKSSTGLPAADLLPDAIPLYSTTSAVLAAVRAQLKGTQFVLVKTQIGKKTLYSVVADSPTPPTP